MPDRPNLTERAPRLADRMNLDHQLDRRAGNVDPVLRKNRPANTAQ
jgi:hypothetical protein